MFNTKNERKDMLKRPDEDDDEDDSTDEFNESVP